MEIGLLRFFIAVYETNSMSEAAKKCYVSQPRITKGIQEFEATMGKALFNRLPKKVVPTEAGEYLYPHAKRILFDFEALPYLFLNEKLKENIKVGIGKGVPYQLQQDFYKKVASVIPTVEWELLSSSLECDFYLTEKESRPSDTLFIPLWEESYVLCVPTTHDYSKRVLLGLEDLHNQKFLFCSSSSEHKRIASLMEPSGGRFQVAFHGENYTDLIGPLVAGLGITILPKFLVDGWNGFRIRPLSSVLSVRSIGVAYVEKVLSNVSVERIVQSLNKK